MKDIFQRLKAGELVHLHDPEFSKVDAVVNRTLSVPAFNIATSTAEIRERLSDIIGSFWMPLPPSSGLSAPIPAAPAWELKTILSFLL